MPALALFTLVLAGCGPSAEETARRQAHLQEEAAKRDMLCVYKSECEGQAIARNPGTAPTLARPLDSLVTPLRESRHRLVGCLQGGDLVFLIGDHRVRIDPKVWRLEVRLANENVPRFPPVQACESDPLRVFWLRVVGPLDEDPYSWASAVTLADGTDPQLRQIRNDFLPHESTCRRWSHWTWCGTEKTVQEHEKLSPQGSSSYVSVKFDLDFYKAPMGDAFFISSLGDSPLHLSPWGVTYRWDTTLVIGYEANPCKRPIPNQKPDCSPGNLIENDQRVRNTVRSLLGVPKADRGNGENK